MKAFILFALVAIFAVAHAGDYIITQTFSCQATTNAPLSLGINNTASQTLSSVTFTVVTSDSNVGINYNGQTKATVGSISAGTVGYGTFWVYGPPGINYVLTFTLSYKKGVVSYSSSAIATLVIQGDSSGGSKREVEDADASLAVRENDLRGDSTASFAPTGANAFQIYAGIPTWVTFYVAANAIVKNLTFTVGTTDSNVQINYGAPNANYLGQINAGQSKAASIQLVGPGGFYQLTFQATYRKNVGTTWYTTDISYAELLISTGGSGGSKRSAYELDVSERAALEADVIDADAQVDGSMKTEYVIGFGVGIAFLAGIAVGAAVFAFKRSATNTIA